MKAQTCYRARHNQHGAREFTKVKGYPILLGDEENRLSLFAIQPFPHEWEVIEAQTGSTLTYTSCPTRRGAICQAERVITERGIKIVCDRVDSILRSDPNAISPLYRKEQTQ